ncbi:MAG: hypothetical protein ICCCNLDF_03408 [Planctomycetes bacterium]|nr:hypothetical protein [Planctomycetota bacterium]
MKRVYIEPSAKADVESVFWYYELAHPGLGQEFKSRVADALRRIAEFPGATPEIEPGVRWLMLKQFPFKLFYLSEEDPLRVVAVIHAAAEPDTWRRALGS